MRTPILILVAAISASTASVAQEKSTRATSSAVAVPAGEEWTKERQELSWALKNILGDADGLMKRAHDRASGATGTELDEFRGMADALGDIRVRIIEQLDRVNKAPAQEGGAVFGSAREFIASTTTALAGYRSGLKTAKGE